MIERTGIMDEVELECDVCGETEEFECFEDAVDFKRDKSNGWKSAKVDDDWYDLCPECNISNIRR